MGNVNLMYDPFLSGSRIACKPAVCILFYSAVSEKYRLYGVFAANRGFGGRLWSGGLQLEYIKKLAGTAEGSPLTYRPDCSAAKVTAGG
jgi:hypothetical protein